MRLSTHRFFVRTNMSSNIITNNEKSRGTNITVYKQTQKQLLLKIYGKFCLLHDFPDENKIL